MNESFVENYINDTEIRNFEKYECCFSSCGEYLAISVGSQNDQDEKIDTLVFYDNENHFIEPQLSNNNYLADKINQKLILFKWNPNLTIVSCIWQNEKIGFFRIKHDIKKWIYNDAILEIAEDDESNKKKSNDDSDSDSSIDSSIIKKKLNLKIIHMSWINEGNTLYYVTNNGLLKFFDFNLTENELKLSIVIQIKDELANCVEVYLDQHLNIYLSSINGSVYLVNELTKEVFKIIQLKFPILKMIHFKRKSKLVIISNDFILYQYNILNQQLNEQQKPNIIESSNVRLEISNKSFNHVEKLIEKQKSTKKNKKTISFKHDDIFILKIDENFGIICICIIGERVIRLFQIDSGQNLAVIAIESTDYQWSGVSCLIYSENSHLLLAGTNNQFLIWMRNVYNLDKQQSEISNYSNEFSNNELINSKQFEFNKLAQFLFDGAINSICINKNSKIAVISNSMNICLIEKQILNFTFLNGLAVVQQGAKDLKALWIDDNQELFINLNYNIKEVFLNSSLNKLAIRTNKLNELIIVGIKDYNTYEIIKTFQIQNYKIILQDNYIWQLNFDINKTKTLTNQVGLSLNCFSLVNDDKNEQQIYPIDLEKNFKNKERIQLSLLDCNHNQLLIIIQSELLIQNYCYLVYELNQDEARLKCKATMILVDDQIMDAKINSTGCFIALIDNNQVFLLKVGSDELQPIKLNLQKIDQLHFSSNEPRLLSIQNQELIFIFICFPDNNLNDKINYHLYDKKQINVNAKLIGFQVPFVYILNKDENLQIIKESLSEFDEISIEIVKLIIDFLTDKKDLNLMIKKINKINQTQNENLWLNLARISVKCRNIEMGLYCMAKLKNVRVIRDVQNELKDKLLDKESKDNLALGILAMNLNLFQEAEALFKLSNQNLKLVEYYQSRNDWRIALKTIEKLNERSLFYDYAKYYENELNDIDNAIKFYEKSCTNNFEVTRMLFDLNELEKLKEYCLNGKLLKNNDNNEDLDNIKLNNLKRYYAQYCESIGDFQSSLKAYEQAKDYYNQVRLLCLIGNLEEAKKIVNLNDNLNSVKSFEFDNVPEKANLDSLNFLNKHNNVVNEEELEKQSKNSAMLHLGKHLESIDPAEAVQYYLSSGAINHAIRTCKSNQFDEQLIKIIQNYGSRNEIIDLLKKIDENEDNYENLYHLYLKIDMIDKSLEIGFKGRLWSNLRQFLNSYLDKIYKNKNEESSINDNEEKLKKIEISDETIEIAIEYLKNNSQIIDIVINLLLIKGAHKNLIKDLILDYKIDINNELIEKIEKLFDENNSETNSKSLLQSLAESALVQGKYLIAAKLFNSTNDRVNSIKSLVRLGDVQKVINYANISRDKTVYKIAASFLQTTQGNEKTIELFYKKAGVKRENNINQF